MDMAVVSAGAFYYGLGLDDLEEARVLKPQVTEDIRGAT